MNNTITCNFCGAQVPIEDTFCIKCGKPLTASQPVQPPSQTQEPPAELQPPPAESQQAPAQSQQPTEINVPLPVEAYVEASSAFASGLPNWSIEPPLIIVRKKGRIW